MYKTRYCTVPGCSTATTHNSLAHHYNIAIGTELQQYQVLDIPIDQQCTIQGCRHRNTHTVAGHKCRVCDNADRSFGHSHQDCKLFVLEKMQCYYAALAPDSKEKVYFWRWNGMGRIVVYSRTEQGIERFYIDQHSPKEYQALKVFTKGCVPLRECDMIGISAKLLLN